MKENLKLIGGARPRSGGDALPTGCSSSARTTGSPSVVETLWHGGRHPDGSHCPPCARLPGFTPAFDGVAVIS